MVESFLSKYRQLPVVLAFLCNILAKMSLRFFHPDVIHGREVVKRRNGSLLIAPRQKLTQKRRRKEEWKNEAMEKPVKN